MAVEGMQKAFQYDVRPLVRKAMICMGGSLDTVGEYRYLEIRKKLIASRGESPLATGL